MKRYWVFRGVSRTTAALLNVVFHRKHVFQVRLFVDALHTQDNHRFQHEWGFASRRMIVLHSQNVQPLSCANNVKLYSLYWHRDWFVNVWEVVKLNFCWTATWTVQTNSRNSTPEGQKQLKGKLWFVKIDQFTFEHTTDTFYPTGLGSFRFKAGVGWRVCVLVTPFCFRLRFVTSKTKQHTRNKQWVFQVRN